MIVCPRRRSIGSSLTSHAPNKEGEASRRSCTLLSGLGAMLVMGVACGVPPNTNVVGCPVEKVGLFDGEVTCAAAVVHLAVV